MIRKGKLEMALERAKLRKSGQTPEPASVSSLEPKARATMPTAPAEEQRAPASAMPVFPQVSFDPRTCAVNRILVPDGHNPSNAPSAAAYRMLRTRVLHRAQSNRWTSIGVTSPGAGDGKSVTALNLALTLAREHNNNVFLIDLDMRNPRMCSYLGVIPPVEITTYFTHDIPPRDALFSIGIEKLTLAGTRTRTDEASELLATQRVEELFEYIRSIAPDPLILLDLPPILATDDALVVAPKIDACLLVLAEGVSRRDAAAKALELLAEYKIAGIVLNRSTGVATDYYGY
jgi:protein-tyrosine kinase